MWQLWTRAKTYNQLPSSIWSDFEHPVFGHQCTLAAWMLDSAVTWFGITIENALGERVKVGRGANVEYQPRYTLARLLHPQFKLPKPPPEPEINLNPFAPFMSWVGKGGGMVKKFAYVPPKEEVLN